jgi:hypothetical protein
VTWIQVVLTMWIYAVTFAAAGVSWLSVARIEDKFELEQFVSESASQAAERLIAGEVTGKDGDILTYENNRWTCQVRIDSTDNSFHLVAEAEGETLELWIPKS